MRGRLGAAFVVLLLALTACGVIDAVTKTEEALVAAGYEDPSLSWFSEGGEESVYVTWTADAETREALEAESLGAAEVIWRVAPVRFDVVETEPDAPAFGDAVGTRRVFPRDRLEREFGPRPAGLDQDLDDLANVEGIVWTFLVLVFLGLAAITLIVVLVVRTRRRQRPAPAGWPGQWQGQWPGQWQPPPPVPGPADPNDPYGAPPP